MFQFAAILFVIVHLENELFWALQYQIEWGEDVD